MQTLVYAPSTPRWIACRLLTPWWPGACWSRLSGLRRSEVAVPALPGPEWVRLRTLMGGICGTDLRLLGLRNHPSTYIQGMISFPMVLGHENLAQIDETGSAVEGWRAGERVCAEPALACQSRGLQPPCPPCSAGLFSLCERVAGDERFPAGMMLGLNRFTGGSWAPYFLAHQSQLHRVPRGLPDEQAILVDPLACGLHGVLRRVPQDDERVLIIGAGIIGLAIAGAIRALGSRAHITTLTRHPFQEAWCRRFGADEVVRFARGMSARQQFDDFARRLDGQRVDGRFGNHGLLGGYDVTYDCVGSGRSMGDSFKLTRARGTTVLMGTSHIALVDTTPMWSKELTVLGGSGRQIERFDGREMHTYELVFELIAAGKLDPAGLLTHTFALRDYKAALAALTSRGRKPVIKAAFVPE
jgi:threonine dehydrogenase-like Zn-dependent dehydrogenase